MDEKSFITRVVEDTVALLLDDLRDLSNPELSVFYQQPEAISRDEINTGYDEAASFRVDSELPVIAKSEFSTQAVGRGLNLFIKVLESIGVEKEYTEDLISESVTTKLPELGALGAFIQDQELQGRTITIENIRSKLNELSYKTPSTPVSGSILHLNEPDPPTIVDEFAPIWIRLENIRDYVRAYLR